MPRKSILIRKDGVEVFEKAACIVGEGGLPIWEIVSIFKRPFTIMFLRRAEKEIRIHGWWEDWVFAFLLEGVDGILKGYSR